MSKIKNYSKGDRIATGFVRPKVTALFYDKLWIPESMVNISPDFMIPNEVRVFEKRKPSVFHRINNTHLYELATVSNKGKKLNFDDFSQCLDFYVSACNRNRGYHLSDVDSELYIGCEYLSKNYESIIKNITQPDENFKYSSNRNSAIIVIAENFTRQYNIGISPVFHDFTEFEKSMQMTDSYTLYDNQKYGNQQNPHKYTNKTALSICIQEYPSIKEDGLSWEQVLDIRKDKKSVQKLKRFVDWSSKELIDLTPNEMQYVLEKRLDDYKFVLKKHGIQTAIGGISTILSAANSIPALFNPESNRFLLSLSISAGLITYTTNSYLSYLEDCRNPIAFLYDVIN